MTVEVRGLRHRFGPNEVLHGVTFMVPRGSVFGLLGPNGAGKSTTVRILLGLLRPAEGEVRVAGVDPVRDGVAVRARVGYVPERQALYETLTPREHLAFAARVRGLEDAVRRRRSDALLRTLGLADRAEETIRSFSKGMRQKVQIALALLHRPEVLVLDEPLSGLDAPSAILFKEIVRGWAERGGSVLYGSHVLDVVEKVCDRAVVLDEGRVVAEGSIEELRRFARGTSLEDVFRSVVDRDPEAEARALVEALWEDGGECPRHASG